MRIIDLLVLIANEEWDKLPKKIKICGTIMNFDEEYQDYNYRDNWFLEDFNFYHSLNNEVEIIEEQPKKIEKLDIVDSGYENEKAVVTELHNYTISAVDFFIINKLNEIIKKINEESEKE